jgi:imidazolonepropionase-like amidohydrolase/WD40 repeat protein
VTLVLLLPLFLTACSTDRSAPNGDEPFSFAFTTQEVTDPDVAVSPDGTTLVFTMVGHLFRLPAAGGDAEQLTFGLAYDFDPVFSPDGTRLAFVSDRDGTEGNLFVLEIDSGEIRQLTHEPFGVARPAWSPDGSTLYYLNLLPPQKEPWVHLPSHYPSTLKAVSPDGGQVTTLEAEPRFHTSVLVLADGRLAFSEILPGDRFEWEFDPEGGPSFTRIIARSEAGGDEILVTVPGMAHRVSALRRGSGFIARYIARPHRRGWGLVEEHVAFLSVDPDSPVSALATVTGTGGWDWGPAIAVHRDSGRIYFGQDGRLAALNLVDGSVAEVPFRARVQHTAFRPRGAPAWNPTDPAEARPRQLSSPQQLPDGTGTLVIAGGQLWRVPADGREPEWIYGETGILRSAVLSPDGTRVALVIREHDIEFLKSLSLGSRVAEEVARDGDYSDVSWSPDGSEILFGERAPEGVRDSLGTAPAGDPRFRFPLPPPTLITGVRLLDFERGRFTAATSVLLQEGRIRAVGDGARELAPSGTAILAGDGRYLLPGFIDLHWHFYGVPDASTAYLPFYGVTSVREVGSRVDPSGVPELADLGDLHRGLVPRVFRSGFYDTERRVETDSVSPSDHAKLGASWIKTYATLPWSVQARLAAEARAAGLPVAGHGWHTREVVKGATLGFGSLEHMGYAWHDDLIQLVRAVGTVWVPTLGNMSADRVLALREPGRLDVPAVRAFGRGKELPDESADNPHGSMEMVRRSLVGQRASIRKAHEAGIPVLIGTDMASEPSLFGQATHWEMEHLVEAGIPPLAVLRAATLGAAEALGAEAQLGSIEGGKLADLVILDADPLADIHNTTLIWRVSKAGWILDPDTVVSRMERLRN